MNIKLSFMKSRSGRWQKICRVECKIEKKNIRFLMSTLTKVLGQFSHSFEVCLPRRLILYVFFRWVFAATLLSVLIIILPGLSFLLCDEIFSSPCSVSPRNHNYGCASACKVFLYYTPIRVVNFSHAS